MSTWKSTGPRRSQPTPSGSDRMETGRARFGHQAWKGGKPIRPCRARRIEPRAMAGARRRRSRRPPRSRPQQERDDAHQRRSWARWTTTCAATGRMSSNARNTAPITLAVTSNRSERPSRAAAQLDLGYRSRGRTRSRPWPRPPDRPGRRAWPGRSRASARARAAVTRDLAHHHGVEPPVHWRGSWPGTSGRTRTRLAECTLAELAREHREEQERQHLADDVGGPLSDRVAGDGADACHRAGV